MRLYDRVLQDPLAKEIRKCAHQTTVLCIDAVAASFAQSLQWEWGPDDYPYARMPFETAFVEWNVPAEAVAKEGVNRNARKYGLQQFGLFVTHYTGKELANLRDTCIQKGIPDGDQIDIAYTCMPFSSVLGTAKWPGWVWQVAIREDGRVICGGATAYSKEMTTNYTASQLNDGALMMVTPVYLAFSLANCKNVSLVDVTDSVAPPPKIRRRLKLPEVKRYTLKIGNELRIPSYKHSDAPAQEGVMPYHLCRGHFATYTADKPMFCNPKLVGRFWHPPHMKGKKERGEIVKDYAIEQGAAP